MTAEWGKGPQGHSTLSPLPTHTQWEPNQENKDIENNILGEFSENHVKSHSWQLSYYSCPD